MARISNMTLDDSALGRKRTEAFSEPWQWTEYEYITELRQVAFIVGRIDYPRGGKKIIPYSPDGSMELPAAYRKKNTRPLFNLPVLLNQPSNGRVVIVEGEKCVEAGARVFPDDVVMTWQGGARALDMTDWAPLKIRDVLLIADHDGPGRRAMQYVADKLKRLRCAVRVYAREGEDKVENDIADWSGDLLGEELDALRQEIEVDAVEPWELPEDGGKEEPPLFEEVTPWDGEVDGGHILDALSSTIRKHMVMEDYAADAVALWSVLTWLHDHAELEVAPFLNITAPTIQSGKSTLLGIVKEFVRGPLADTGSSEAYLFRTINRYQPTMLMDEIDLKSKENQVFAAMLNGSQLRESAWIGRAEPTANKQWREVRYSTWCPKVLCGIGGLSEATTSRCIQVKLERAPKGKRPPRWRSRDKHLVTEIRAKLARWTIDNADAIVAGRDAIDFDAPPLDHLTDRQADGWQALLSTAERAGGEWPGRAREACLSIVKEADDNRSVAELLIGDIRAIFTFYDDPDWMATKQLLAHLNSMHERRWPTFRRGDKPMNAMALSFQMRKFGLVPIQRMRDGRNNRGYLLSSTSPVAARYPAIDGDKPLEMLENINSGLDDAETM